MSTTSTLAPPETIVEPLEGILVSATYDGDKHKAVLKFYDVATDRIWSLDDNTGHMPYCYTKLTRADLNALGFGVGKNGIVGIEEVQKFDFLSESTIEVRKIIATDPLSIGGESNGLRDKFDCWEADIKYYENYVYDRGLKIGTHYKLMDGNLVSVEKEVPDMVVKRSLESVLVGASGASAAQIKDWAELLGQPLIVFKRIACDIEVANEEGRVPDPEDPVEPVIAVAFHGDKESLVFILQRNDKMTDTLPPQAILFADEASMLLATFRKMDEYPFLLTFNGDEFDMAYLKGRGKRLGIKDEDIPIVVGQQQASLRNGIHIDLYKFFHNRSIQIYVYAKKYTDFKLNDISVALLDKEKIEFDGNVKDLALGKLAEYCLNDAMLTYELTSNNDSLLMKVLLILTRVAKMPINDTARLSVSNWIRSMLFYDHRRKGALIPRPEELAAKGGVSTTAMVKGKKYKGALVIEPKPGIYFKVSVLDFASLYPSIIKKYNLSYETMNCSHPECKTNKVPETAHWVCTKNDGVVSLAIGSLRELRVHHYKHLSKNKDITKEERNTYKATSEGLKVILNAAYGTLGFESFALYCVPAAEATAALGRHAITKAIEKASEVGMPVIYSDTDSIYLQEATEEKMKIVERWAINQLGLELEVDKTYRYVAFSQLKKNYFGVLEDGTLDVKGLTGKKRQTPAFLKKAFYDCIDILREIFKREDFDRAKTQVKGLVSVMVSNIERRTIPIEEMSFHTALGKATGDYRETIPQHVEAGKLLEERTGIRLKAGETVDFVKTRWGAKPASLVKSEDIDTAKYLEYAENMFAQILDPLDISFAEVAGTTRLDAFWS